MCSVRLLKSIPSSESTVLSRRNSGDFAGDEPREQRLFASFRYSSEASSSDISVRSVSAALSLIPERSSRDRLSIDSLSRLGVADSDRASTLSGSAWKARAVMILWSGTTPESFTSCIRVEAGIRWNAMVSINGAMAPFSEVPGVFRKWRVLQASAEWNLVSSSACSSSRDRMRRTTCWGSFKKAGKRRTSSPFSSTNSSAYGRRRFKLACSQNVV